MKIILKSVLKVLGAKRLIMMAIDLAYPELKKLAAKTPTELDDNALEMLVNLIKEVLGEKEFADYVADSKLHAKEASNLVA